MACVYQSNLGEPIHQLERDGRKHLLLWLNEPMLVGDIKTIETTRQLVDTYRSDREWHELDVRHRCRRASVTIMFPKGRRPSWVRVGLTAPGVLGTEIVDYKLTLVEDKRTRLSWTVKQPPLNSTIRTEWVW